MISSFDHPYRDRPARAFWKKAVAESSIESFDPVTDLPFRIGRTDRVATAGSCFAQHISRAIAKEGVSFVQTETAPAGEAAALPVYSARYGNIYTSLQLRQLLERAYGLFVPRHVAWRREDGRYVDPFRPNEFPAGFATIAEVEAATREHLAAVREVFETCDVFVFTLGLTEVWLSNDDGSAFPLPPGVAASPIDPDQRFAPVNLTVDELTDDMIAFVDDLRLVNPKARILLTVSPVPIIATFEDRHVIVSNAYTKAVLRVVADNVERRRENVYYFPSYEMIVTHPKANYFNENFRAVRPEGVAAVMKVFRTRLLRGDEEIAPSVAPHEEAPSIAEPPPSLEDEFKNVICDEEMIARGLV